jgi:molybdate transport system regulatory protein
VRLEGGDIVTSSISKEAAEELGVGAGSEVTVVIKSSDVMIAVAD